MPAAIVNEIKTDLEYIYKISSDLLNLLEEKEAEGEYDERRQLYETVRFKLMDIGGTLQKDIFKCDFLVTKTEIGGMVNK